MQLRMRMVMVVFVIGLAGCFSGTTEMDRQIRSTTADPTSSYLLHPLISSWTLIKNNHSIKSYIFVIHGLLFNRNGLLLYYSLNGSSDDFFSEHHVLWVENSVGQKAVSARVFPVRVREGFEVGILQFTPRLVRGDEIFLCSSNESKTLVAIFEGDLTDDILDRTFFSALTEPIDREGISIQFTWIALSDKAVQTPITNDPGITPTPVSDSALQNLPADRIVQREAYFLIHDVKDQTNTIVGVLLFDDGEVMAIINNTIEQIASILLDGAPSADANYPYP